jgi:hypothetical protein
LPAAPRQPVGRRGQESAEKNSLKMTLIAKSEDRNMPEIRKKIDILLNQNL